MTPEQQARQNIDAQLLAAGWIVQDYAKMDLSAGRGIALREVPLKSGRCDYLLLVDRKPVGVIEAKKERTLLSTVAEQSGRYAENLPDFLAGQLSHPLPFLYESTGIETFFRDERDPEPRSRLVFGFHRPETLADRLAQPDTPSARLQHLPPMPTQGMRDCQVALVKLPRSSTNSLSGSISPKTGLLTVTFGDGTGRATTTGKGAVLQNVTNAAGFFLSKTNAGSILLQP